MERIEQRLRLSMGMDPSSIGSSTLQRTIRLRMKAAGLSTIEEYEHLINTSAGEWSQLVEAVVVTETWFFRDCKAFSALVTMVQTDWLPAHATGRVSILSLPCSSGEEPYSIAMALMDAGVSPERFVVHGVDLSERVLQKAAAGVYSKNSFRGKDLDYRDRHFEQDGESYSVKQPIRDCVAFRQANLLSDDFRIERGAYDFVFCRNLLIYFDHETQRRALDRLGLLLTPKGTLFVGPAEIPLATANGFGSSSLPMAFACRRAGVARITKQTIPSSRTQRLQPDNLRVSTRLPVAVLPKLKSEITLPNGGLLGEARNHADGGRLNDAARLCRAHLDQHGASVDAFYLLGIIHDAMGQPEAREFYRKALYLDPNHYESLKQMALLAEREGDAVSARNLRRRAKRLEINSDAAS